jgi:HSP20 family protein
MAVRHPFFGGWDPWRDLGMLQKNVNRLLNEDGKGGAAIESPAVNVWRNENGVVITTEIPGVDPNDVDISVVGETVTLRVVRKPEELPQNAKYHRRERVAGQFVRSLQLPFRVDTQKTVAKYERGVLSVTLAPHEEEKPKKISITSA